MWTTPLNWTCVHHSNSTKQAFTKRFLRWHSSSEKWLSEGVSHVWLICLHTVIIGKVVALVSFPFDFLTTSFFYVHTVITHCMCNILSGVCRTRFFSASFLSHDIRIDSFLFTCHSSVNKPYNILHLKANNNTIQRHHGNHENMAWYQAASQHRLSSLAASSVCLHDNLWMFLAGIGWWLCSCRVPPGSSRAGHGCCPMDLLSTFSPKVSHTDCV